MSRKLSNCDLKSMTMVALFVKYLPDRVPTQSEIKCASEMAELTLSRLKIGTAECDCEAEV